MPTKETLRNIVRGNIASIVAQLNRALRGEIITELEAPLSHLGRDGKLPTWYAQLARDHTLPNLDGKTIGSVIEMILVAVLERFTFEGLGLQPLRVNPARGVDLPDLDLSIKSPSKNFCTSEPFFSSYERLFGSEYDALVLLTDYQEAKKHPPLKLQITGYRYLTKSQVADRNLCRIALLHRDWLLAESESRAQRIFRFLAYVNQSDWRARRLLSLIEHMRDADAVSRIVEQARKDITKTNRRNEKEGMELIPDSEFEALEAIKGISPSYIGVVDAADNWVTEVLKDAARLPNENEWIRLRESALDGKIGISFAFQWRYNFGSLFGKEDVETDTNNVDVVAV